MGYGGLGVWGYGSLGVEGCFFAGKVLARNEVRGFQRIRKEIKRLKR